MRTFHMLTTLSGSGSARKWRHRLGEPIIAAPSPDCIGNRLAPLDSLLNCFGSLGAPPARDAGQRYRSLLIQCVRFARIQVEQNDICRLYGGGTFRLET